MATNQLSCFGTLRPMVLIAAFALALVSVPIEGRAASNPLVMPGQASETATVVVPEDLTLEEIPALLATMTDDQARRELLQLLEAKTKAKQKTSSGGGLGVGLVKFRKNLESLSQRLRKDAAKLRDGYAKFPQDFATALRKLSGTSGWSSILTQLALFMVLGLGGFAVIAHLTRNTRAGLRQRRPVNLIERLTVAGLRAGLNALPLGAFAIVAFGGVTLAYPESGPERNFVVSYLSGILLCLAAGFVLRLVLAPRAPGLRLVPISDGAADFFFHWLTLLAASGILLWLTAGLLILTGMSLPVHLFVVIVTGSIVLGLVVAMIVSGREILAALAVGSEAHDNVRLGIAKAIPWALVLYVMVIWLHWSEAMLARESTGLWSAIAGLAILALLPVLDRWGCDIFDRAFGLEKSQSDLDRLTEAKSGDVADEQARSEMPEVLSEDAQTQALSDAQKGWEARRRYANMTKQGARLFVGSFVLVYILAQLGLDITGFGAAQTQVWLVSTLFSVATVILVSYVLWRLFVSCIDPYMPARREVIADEEGGPAQTRVETLMPLMRNSVKIILIVFTAMFALAETGLNIGPLLAGAGVIGIAIGFGAQKLVQDIVSGIFFLIDDAFRIGEYVEFGDLRGEVEGITVRSLKLRHHRGAIHTVPYSELRTVTNYNRDWVIYKMEFRLPHDVNVPRVKKIVKQIGLELMNDPDHGPNLIQPLKSQGITRMDETAVILRTKFMCKPREQFVLRRVAYEKIKEAFAANGIEFAGRHVTVRSDGGGRAGAESNAAAASALQQQGDDGGAIPDTR